MCWPPAWQEDPTVMRQGGKREAYMGKRRRQEAVKPDLPQDMGHESLTLSFHTGRMGKIICQPQGNIPSPKWAGMWCGSSLYCMVVHAHCRPMCFVHWMHVFLESFAYPPPSLNLSLGEIFSFPESSSSSDFLGLGELWIARFSLRPQSMIPIRWTAGFCF